LNKVATLASVLQLKIYGIVQSAALLHEGQLVQVKL